MDPKELKAELLHRPSKSMSMELKGDFPYLKETGLEGFVKQDTKKKMRLAVLWISPFRCMGACINHDERKMISPFRCMEACTNHDEGRSPFRCMGACTNHDIGGGCKYYVTFVDNYSPSTKE